MAFVAEVSCIVFVGHEIYAAPHTRSVPFVAQGGVKEKKRGKFSFVNKLVCITTRSVDSAG